MSGGGPPLAGVIGWPIGHSISPRLHGHWLRRYGIEGYYVPIAVPPDGLAEALRALPALGFRGVNVTIPHKVAALGLAASVSDRAARIGAANTLTFGEGGRFHADNTDGYGFLAGLQQAVPGWNPGRPALVLGAGGAARAVVAALRDAGAPVRLANRTRTRAEALRAHFGAGVDLVGWTEAAAAMADAATVVNTTSLGMAGQPALELALDAAPQDAVVIDLVYRPLETALLAEARRRGLAAVDGLGMLLHQAVPGFEAWFGRWPEVDAALRAAVLGT